MSLDDQIRHAADSLASDLGREIQTRFDRLAGELMAAAAAERHAALAAQAGQPTVDADARLHDEVARARTDASNDTAVLLAQARGEAAEVTARLHAEHARQAEHTRHALERETLERHARLADMERLVESFRRLDAADSLKALLDALADASAQESSRAAIFLVRGQELQGWRFAGFADAPSDPRQVSVPLETAGGLADAIRQQARAEVHADSAPRSLAFMAMPGTDVGVAVPVIVGGDVAAVIYGDDGAVEARVVPAAWPESLELLSRHASRCLEAQTALRASRFGGSRQAAAPGRATDSRVEVAMGRGPR